MNELLFWQKLMYFYRQRFVYEYKWLDFNDGFYYWCRVKRPMPFFSAIVGGS